MKLHAGLLFVLAAAIFFALRGDGADHHYP